jgi:hypothetical protein
VSGGDELRAAARKLRKQADGGFHPELADALDDHAEDHSTYDCYWDDPCSFLRTARVINGGVA